MSLYAHYYCLFACMKTSSRGKCNKARECMNFNQNIDLLQLERSFLHWSLILIYNDTLL